MNETMLEILCDRLTRISDATATLLREHCGMTPANKPGDVVVFISASDNHFWKPLSPEGKRIQVDLLPKVQRFGELLEVIAQDLPRSAQKELKTSLKRLRETVEQHGTTWWQSPAEAVSGIQDLTAKIRNLLEEYFDSDCSTSLAIPDTNAVLHDPNIESWQVDGHHELTLLLTPTVVSELDNHKINHKNPDVRTKASTFIRKLKEYRRRGSLLEGVTIVKGRLSLRALSNEPDMSKALSWLDPGNADDRFLATVLEAIRSNLSTSIFIITFDINMQNKAELAGIPYRELEVDSHTGS